jgi:hypothetical protein
MIERSFTTTIISDDDSSMCAIEVPFDPREIFGKVRAPVRVTINDHTFRSTIARYGVQSFIPLRRSNREAAKVEGGQTVRVTLMLDEEERVVKPPADLVKALKAGGVFERWKQLSFTHQREYAEAVADSKKPETRKRRIAKAVEAISKLSVRKRPKKRAI